MVCRLWQAAHPLCKVVGYLRSVVETGSCNHLRMLRGSVALAALVAFRSWPRNALNHSFWLKFLKNHIENIS
jgi:hypothetical protein